MNEIEVKLKHDHVVDTFIKLMEQTERFVDKNGQQKKHYVLAGIQSIIGPESFKRYNYFIDMFIDCIVSISKGRTIYLNKKNIVVFNIKMVEESDDVVIKLIQTPDNYNEKIEMIKNILEEVKK
jgi:hypothetical protein